MKLDNRKILVFLLILVSCTKPEFNNPFDPKIDLEQPSNFNHTRLAINKIQLNWDDTYEKETGYRIDKKVNDNDWENNYAILLENTNIWTDENAEINQIIQYRITVLYDENFSTPALSEQVNNTIPEPENLNVSHLSLTEIKLNWNYNLTGIEGFKIDKKIDSNEWIFEYDSIDANILEWIDVNVEVNAGIQYRAYAFVNNLNSTKNTSDIIENYFPSPTNLYINVSIIDSLTLIWNYDCDLEEGFAIDRKIGSGGWTINFDSTSADVTEWVDVSLEIGNSYYYRVRAYANEHFSDYSNEISIEYGFSEVSCIVSIEENINPTGATIQLIGDFTNYQSEIISGNSTIIEDVIYGNYEAICSFWGYNDDIQNVNIYHETLTIDFNLNLGDGYWVHYDSDNNSGIGLIYGGDFNCAIRLTNDELNQYINLPIFKIRIFINDSLLEFRVRIWEGGNYGNPGSLIYDIPIETPQINNWNEYLLENPVMIQENNEYWIGYYLNHNSGYYPAGVDEGPVIEGKGAWINTSGNNWEELIDNNSNLNYNFNIRIFLVEVKSKKDPILEKKFDNRIDNTLKNNQNTLFIKEIKKNKDE